MGPQIQAFPFLRRFSALLFGIDADHLAESPGSCSSGL